MQSCPPWHIGWPSRPGCQDEGAGAVYMVSTMSALCSKVVPCDLQLHAMYSGSDHVLSSLSKHTSLESPCKIQSPCHRMCDSAAHQQLSLICAQRPYMPHLLCCALNRCRGISKTLLYKDSSAQLLHGHTSAGPAHRASSHSCCQAQPPAVVQAVREGRKRTHARIIARPGVGRNVVQHLQGRHSNNDHNPDILP